MNAEDRKKLWDLIHKWEDSEPRGPAWFHNARAVENHLEIIGAKLTIGTIEHVLEDVGRHAGVGKLRRKLATTKMRLKRIVSDYESSGNVNGQI